MKGVLIKTVYCQVSGEDSVGVPLDKEGKQQDPENIGYRRREWSYQQDLTNGQRRKQRRFVEITIPFINDLLK